MKIGFVGATHLGICYFSAASEKGFNVICYDEDKELIRNLNNPKPPFFEKNLTNILKKKTKTNLSKDLYIFNTLNNLKLK